MRHMLVVLIGLTTFAAWLPVQAAPMNRPQAEYSADATVENEEGTMKQKIFVTPTKERKEMLTGSGEGAVQIFRYDNKVMWMLMPSENMYMEYSIGAGPSRGSDTSQWTYEDTAMGEETLNGVRVTKYKTIATSTDGKKYGGFSWRTACSFFRPRPSSSRPRGRSWCTGSTRGRRGPLKSSPSPGPASRWSPSRWPPAGPATRRPRDRPSCPASAAGRPRSAIKR